MPSCERLATLDLQLFFAKMRIIAVYMPDSSHSDESVDILYSLFDSSLKDADDKKLQYLLQAI